MANGTVEVPVSSGANTQPHSGRASHHIGMVGEGRFISWASSQGWHIYRGLDGHTPCDFVVDNGERLLRVEVKRLQTVQRTHNNYYYITATKLNSNNFDFIFVSTPEVDYWIPAEECPFKTLSIKQHGSEYKRSINAEGKYERFIIT